MITRVVERSSEPVVSIPARRRDGGKRQPDMHFFLTVEYADPANATYPSIDDALRAARPRLLDILHNWLRAWLDRVLDARAAGLDPDQIAAALGLTPEEVAFYLDPRVAPALRSPDGALY